MVGGRGPRIVPTMRYADARAAIEWLREAFGFQEHMVVPGEDASIRHAQLVLGDAMIMLGSARDDAFGTLQRPARPGEAVTQSAYLVVEEVGVLHDRAVAAGADIVAPLEEADHGGLFFACRDPQGQLWNVGSYDPWAEDGEG